jgi:ABC-type phosphate transport system ATPase subunit
MNELEQCNESILSLKDYGAAFGEKTILNNVNLQVFEKNITVLLGPSGTGKSTLLRSIAGLNDTNPSFHTWGDAVFSGKKLAAENRPSLVTQSARLVVKSVLENIVHNLPERNNLTQTQQKDLAVRLLEQAELGVLKDSLNENVVSLSLVMQRRIAILRLVSAGPRLLCLDEPTTGIQDAEIEHLLAHIKQESQRRAILVVLHNQQQAKALDGYAALLAGGEVKEYKPSAEFFKNPEAEPAKQFIRTGSCSVPSPDAKPEELSDEAKSLITSAKVNRKFVSESYGPRGFLWLLKGQLAGTPLPGVFFEQNYDLKALQRVGVTCLLSTTQNPVSEKALNSFDIKGKAFPIKDMGVPTLKQALEICQLIEKMIGSEEVVAVHCRAGLGRTGTVLALYLIWQKLDPLSALEKVRNIEPRWVQSDEQVKFLSEFAKYIVDKSPLSPGNHNQVNDVSNAI